MPKLNLLLISLILILIPLYPKFPLVGVSGTFVSVRLEDFVLAFIIGCWFIFSLPKKFASLKFPVQKAILIYLIIGFVSLFSGIFLTKSAALTLGLLHAFRRVEYMVMFIIGFDFLSHRDQIPTLIRTIIIVSFVVAIYGLGQQFLSWPIISTTNSEFAKGLALTLGPGGRINSTFAGHYDLAAFSLFPLLLIMSLLLIPGKHKLVLLLLGIPIYVTFMLTISRFTILAFFAASFILILVFRRRLLLIPLTLIGIISLLLTPGLLGRYQTLIVNHLLSTITIPVVVAQDSLPPVDLQIADALKPPEKPEDRSTNIRLNAEWPRAIRAITKNPVLGTGYSSTGLATDNDFLRLLAETGVLGFAAFMLIMIRLIKSAKSSFFTPPQNPIQAFVLSSLLFLIGMLFNSIFIDIFEASKIAIIIWAIMGLSHKAQHLLEYDKNY